jgi:hypothetical protein
MKQIPKSYLEVGYSFSPIKFHLSLLVETSGGDSGNF